MAALIDIDPDPSAIHMRQRYGQELAAFDLRLRQRLASADQGNTVPAEEAFALLQSKYGQPSPQ